MRTSAIRRRRLLAATVSLAVSVGLTACGGNESSRESVGAVAFVVGARSNMPPPHLAGTALAALDRAVQDQSFVSIVVADGAPFVLDDSGPLTITGANDVAREQSKEANHRAVLDAIAGARAVTPETDLLGAISLGRRSISSATAPGTIVVVDSGLSTVAPLDFSRPGLLHADPQEVVASLEAAGVLPELAGYTVILQGLGDVAPPQEPLDEAQRRNLIAIWEAILRAAGAEVEVEEMPLSGESDPELPKVEAVPVEEGPRCDGEVIELDGADVTFLPDSANFADPETVREVLEPVAAQLVGSGATATLIGTTADVGDLQGQRELSLRRAEAVRAELIDLGVTAERLTVEGLGSDFPGYVEDHLPDGTLDPGAAALNRKVVIDPRDDTVLTCA